MNHSDKNDIQISEKELVQKAQAGDFTAFNQLIEQYRQKIYRLALKMAKNEQDAEDIFQDTFLKAIDKIGQFRAESSFGTWLYAIAVNVARARYGRSFEKDLLPLEEYLPVKPGESEARPGTLYDWDDPLSKMTAGEVQQKLSKAITELPLKYRVAFLLRYIEEMSVQEVAQAMNLTVAAAKSRILRARLALRQSLNDYFTGEAKHVGL